MNEKHLQDFANAIAATEREACVKDVSNALYGQDGCGKAIEAIRARGQSKPEQLYRPFRLAVEANLKEKNT